MIEFRVLSILQSLNAPSEQQVRLPGIVRAWVKAAGRYTVLVFLLLGVVGVSRAADPELENQLAAEVDRFVAADKVSPPAPCQVLFVGSSSIVKWDTLAHDMAPLPVINRGFGGSHIEYVNRWFDQLVAAYRPRAIVFYAGENDLDAGKPVDGVVADFDAFMTRKVASLGSVPVYFISVKPSALRFEEFSLQTRLNDGIRVRAAQRTDLHYIDVVDAMLKNGKPKDLFAEDGLHMRTEGYAIWTRAVKAAMIPNAEAEAHRCAVPELQSKRVVK